MADGKSSPSVVSKQLSEAELRCGVCLRMQMIDLLRELCVAQSYFSEAEVQSMDRSVLIGHVVALRKLANQHTALKTMVQGFKPVSQVVCF